MGLNSSLQKVISYTSKFNSMLNPQTFLNVSVPGANLGKIFGQEDGEGVQTLGDLIGQVEDIGGDIMTGVNLVRCTKYMNWGNIGGLLGSMAMGTASVIMAITDQILDAVAIQLGNAVQQVVGTITAIVDALVNVWTSIELLIDAISDLWDSISFDIDFDIDFELSEKNCKDMYAAIAGCLLNKYLGPYLDEFKEKALNAINKAGNAFNDMLYEELSDARTFAAYAEQEAFLLEKAKIQIKGLTKDNLTAK